MFRLCFPWTGLWSLVVVLVVFSRLRGVFHFLVPASSHPTTLHSPDTTPHYARTRHNLNIFCPL